MTNVKKKWQHFITLSVGPLLVRQTVLFNRLGTLGLLRVAAGVPGQSQPGPALQRQKGAWDTRARNEGREKRK